MNNYLKFILVMLALIIVGFLIPFSLNTNYNPIDCKQIINDNPNSMVLCEDFSDPLINLLMIITHFLVIIVIIIFLIAKPISKIKKKPNEI